MGKGHFGGIRGIANFKNFSGYRRLVGNATCQRNKGQYGTAMGVEGTQDLVAKPFILASVSMK
jgi:hypothetical protein